MYISLKILFGIALFMLIVVISGCKTAKIVKYEHEQSVHFYKNFDFESDVLKGFKADDILLVIDINKMTHTSYIVWLGLYSDRLGKSINIERAMIAGDGWQKSQDFNRKLALDSDVSDHDLFEFDKGLKLFEVNKNDLKSIDNLSGELILTVFYNTGSGTESINFVIKQKVEMQTIFST